LYCVLKKAGQKKSAIRQKKVEKRQQKRTQNKAAKGGKKLWQERWENSLFLNQSCCCLETGLKLVAGLVFIVQK